MSEEPPAGQIAGTPNIAGRLENIEAKLHEALSLLRSLWLAEERRAAIAAATKPQREA